METQREAIKLMELVAQNENFAGLEQAINIRQYRRLYAPLTFRLFTPHLGWFVDMLRDMVKDPVGLPK